MMKKWLLAVLSGIMAFAAVLLAACDDGGENEETVYTLSLGQTAYSVDVGEEFTVPQPVPIPEPYTTDSEIWHYCDNSCLED